MWNRWRGKRATEAEPGGGDGLRGGEDERMCVRAKEHGREWPLRRRLMQCKAEYVGKIGGY